MNPESELSSCGRTTCVDKVCHHQPMTDAERREQNRANKRQVGGDHYLTQPIQLWDYIHKNGIGFLAGSAIKYLSRYQQKDGVQDLEKAKHFLEKLIEEERGHTHQVHCGYQTTPGAPPCEQDAGHRGLHT